MEAKETLNKIKTILGLEVNFETRKLENGTTFESDKFENGSEVFILTEDEQKIPVPQGTYLMEDNSELVVEEEGIIASLGYKKDEDEMKKDKEKVLNETIDESRLADFFATRPPEGVDKDYHILERAYRGLQAPDFARFLTIFKDKGHDINAKGTMGTLLEVVNQHANGAPYAESLKQHGAN